jgi:hypothetical protein
MADPQTTSQHITPHSFVLAYQRMASKHGVGTSAEIVCMTLERMQHGR